MKKICILLSFAFFALVSCENADDIFIEEPISAIEKTPLAVVQPGDIEPIPDPEPEPWCPRHGKRGKGKGKGHAKGKGKGHWK